jgi:hypothetical protein
VSWKFHPHVKVSLDGRYEVTYPEAVFEDVLAFSGKRPGTSWRVRAGRGLSRGKRSSGSPGWRSVYDGSFVVAVRLGSAPCRRRTFP